MKRVETVVIGAGLAGTSVAAHLGEPVLLLEQGEQPGAEASAQNAGMVRRLSEDPVERLLAMRTWRGLEALGEPCSRRVGALIGLVHERGALNDPAAHLRAAGVPVEICDRPAEQAPVLAGAHLEEAWYLPEERVADAHMLVSHFLDRARSQGSELRCRVRVSRLVVESGRVAGVDTDQGPIACDRVLLAAGAWSSALAASAGLKRPLVPIRRTLLHSAPHPLALPTHPWTWLDDVGLYVRPEAGGWLLSGCDERPSPVAPGPGSTGPVEADRREQAAAKVLRWLPALSELTLRGGWSGLRTFAPDRRPLLGPDHELAGLHWAAGLGGFGVTTCLAVGEAVATWMRGEEPGWLALAPVSTARAFPRRWPIRPDGEASGARLISAP